MNAAYVILAAPLLGAILLLFGGRRFGQPLSGVIATLLAAVSFVATLVVWITMLGRSPGNRVVLKGLFTWMPVEHLQVSFGMQLDPLAIFMSLFVSGVSSLIFLYSIGYMKGDPSNPRFFFYLSLFLFSMLVLVLSDNFLFTFLGWEGVGFCSYGLIGFWFERNTAAVAAKKAFVTNRIGDFGFMIALFLMFQHFGSFNYSAVLAPLSAGHLTLSNGFATFLGLMLVLGAVGKSAQIPLYMWLPDAMEGPTPISALIHAATMVTAGVYLLARSAPILHFTPSTLTVIACLGAATAFIALTIACAQDDIKRILAYSTLAEIGFMFLAVGSGSYTSGLFLMVTHAFFKALLFLAAGSVIHAMNDEQNVKMMGGLRRYVPITFVTFIFGYLALSAIPPFSGWWSHEAVLEAAWSKSRGLWIVGVITDGITAYYMSRQVVLVFLGQARWAEARPVAAEMAVNGPEGQGQAAEHVEGAGAPQHAAGAADAHGAHAAGAHGGHGGTPHESPWTMTAPLVILAVCSFFGGLLDLPTFHLELIDHWLASVFPHSIDPLVVATTSTKWVIGVISTAVNFVGLFAGLALWRNHVHRPALEPAFLSRGWYIDDTVAAAVSGPLQVSADGLAYGVEQGLVDGSATGVARLVAATGRQLRRVQTGYVRNYALGIGLGAAVILIYVAARVGS